MTRPKFLDINDKDQWWDGEQWRNEGSTENEVARSELRKLNMTQQMREDGTRPDGVFKCPRCYKMHFVPDNYDYLCNGCCVTLKTHPKATEKMKQGIRYWNSIASNLDHPEVKARYAERTKLELQND